MNRGANSGEFIDPLNIQPMSDTHAAKKPNETTSEETTAAVSRFQSAMTSFASILKSGHSEKPIEYFCMGDGCAGMGGLNEYLNLGGVEAAEPEQEAREATVVYARCFLERAEPPACFNFADEEERRFRFIPFETKFTDDAARGPR